MHAPSHTPGLDARGEEQAVRQLVDAWLAAPGEGDVERVLSLVTDDVVFVAPGQPALRGRAAFAKSHDGRPAQVLEARGKVQEVRVLGDWAMLWTRLTLVTRPRDGGASVTRIGHALSFLHKLGAGWALAPAANLLAGAPMEQRGRG